MTCEEFVALEEDVQPVVAYWLDGYNEGGGSGETKGAKTAETKGAKAAGGAETAGVGAVALDRDVVVVVDECRAAPKASLWQKIKSKF